MLRLIIIGMVLIVSQSKADDILQFARSRKHNGWLIGEVTRGKGIVRLI